MAMQMQTIFFCDGPECKNYCRGKVLMGKTIPSGGKQVPMRGWIANDESRTVICPTCAKLGHVP